MLNNQKFSYSVCNGKLKLQQGGPQILHDIYRKFHNCLLQSTLSQWTPLYKMGTWCWSLSLFKSFNCKYTRYKTDTSLRPTTNIFGTLNGQLGSALYVNLKKEMQVLFMTVNCKIVSILEYVAPVQRVKTVTLLDYKASPKRLLLLGHI